jgi:hypothetical protein
MEHLFLFSVHHILLRHVSAVHGHHQVYVSPVKIVSSYNTYTSMRQTIDFANKTVIRAYEAVIKHNISFHKLLIMKKCYDFASYSQEFKVESRSGNRTSRCLQRHFQSFQTYRHFLPQALMLASHNHYVSPSRSVTYSLRRSY